MAVLIVRRFIWLLGALLALAGGYLLYMGGQANTAMVQVLVTSKAVSPGAILNASDLAWAKVPREAVNSDAVQQPSQILGRTITVPLPADQQVLGMWLSTTNVTLGKNYVDLPLSTSLSTSAVGSLQAGEEVSLLWMPGGLTNQAPAVEYLHHPLIVITVRDAQGNVEGQSTGTPGVSAGAPAILDLRVTPAEAIQLESQEQSGKLIVLGIQQGGSQ